MPPTQQEVARSEPTPYNKMIRMLGWRDGGGGWEAPTKWQWTLHLVAPTSELSHHQQTTQGAQEHVIRGSLDLCRKPEPYFPDDQLLPGLSIPFHYRSDYT